MEKGICISRKFDWLIRKMYDTIELECVCLMDAFLSIFTK